jgi:hypothetical protein
MDSGNQETVRRPHKLKGRHHISATCFYKNLYSSKLPNINVRYSHPVEEEILDNIYSEVRNAIANLKWKYPRRRWHL